MIRSSIYIYIYIYIYTGRPPRGCRNQWFTGQLVSWLTGYLVDRLAGYLAAWLTCEFVTSFVRSSVPSLARAFVCWFVPCLCARVSLFDSFVRLSACLCARVGTCVDLCAS